MKKIISILCLSILLSVSANAADEAGRVPFYLALSHWSLDMAGNMFILDELLTTRCGVAPSIEYLKMQAYGDNRASVNMALKDGNIAEAKARLSSIPCEK